jgi:hypothetical protein
MLLKRRQYSRRAKICINMFEVLSDGLQVFWLIMGNLIFLQ